MDSKQEEWYDVSEVEWHSVSEGHHRDDNAFVQNAAITLNVAVDVPQATVVPHAPVLAVDVPPENAASAISQTEAILGLRNLVVQFLTKHDAYVDWDNGQPLQKMRSI